MKSLACPNEQCLRFRNPGAASIIKHGFYQTRWGKGASSGKCCWFSQAAPKYMFLSGFLSFLLSSNMYEDQKKHISLLSQSRLHAQ